MNILISVNKDYLDKAVTMLFSMRLYTMENITVYLLNHSLSKEAVDKTRNYLRDKCRIRLEEIDVSHTAIDHFPVHLHFSIETYYRILAQFWLPQSLDRVLWLDADIVLLKDISPFYHSEFSTGKKYIVCPDINADSEWLKNQIMQLELPKEHIYFNAGVLLLNLTELRNTTTVDEITEKSADIQDKIRFCDQDILNTLYSGQVMYEDWKKYNYQLTGKNKIPAEDLEEIIVLHYSGRKKPWNYKSIGYVSGFYWNVRIMQGDWLAAAVVYFRFICYWGGKKIVAPIIRMIRDQNEKA